MTLKERYKYFPIEKLNDALLAEEGTAIVSCNGMIVDVSDLAIQEGQNRMEIKYPRKVTGRVVLSVTIRKNQNSTLFLRHISLGGKGKFELNVNMHSGSSLSVVDVTETKGFLKSDFHYKLSSDCTLKVTSVDVNNRMLSRSQVFDINQSGSFVDVKGLYLSSRDEMVDNYIKMNHNAKGAESHQDYRGISSGLASFLGHIYIAPDAQQSIAMQQSRNIVVGSDAHIYARPWLEIYADDVKCNHGATVGTSDEEALFYLCQRGIAKNTAKALLLEGFVSGTLDSAPAMKTKVKSKLYSI